MATAMYCDICGRFISEHRDIRYIFFTQADKEKPSFPEQEICVRCNEKVKDCINTLKEQADVEGKDDQ